MIAPAAAALQIGTGQPFTLHGRPHVCTCAASALAGKVEIELGTTSDGRHVIITADTLQELIELESAIREAFCQGRIQADMRAVTS